MSSKSLDKLANLAASFDKKAQANVELDNLSIALAALFSIAAQLEEKGLTSDKLGSMIEQAKKLRAINPQDVAVGKQMTDSVKPMANYIAHFSEVLKKI